MKNTYFAWEKMPEKGLAPNCRQRSSREFFYLKGGGDARPNIYFSMADGKPQFLACPLDLHGLGRRKIAKITRAARVASLLGRLGILRNYGEMQESILGFAQGKGTMFEYMQKCSPMLLALATSYIVEGKRGALEEMERRNREYGGKNIFFGMHDEANRRWQSELAMQRDRAESHISNEY